MLLKPALTQRVGRDPFTNTLPCRYESASRPELVSTGGGTALSEGRDDHQRRRDKADHYRDTAAHLRDMAEGEPVRRLRTRLLDLARQYEELAEKFQAR
jgi:hypothetical protein